MKNEINFSYEVFKSPSDLSDEEQELLSAAKQGLRGSYAPYSRFKVSASILLSNGVIVVGTNQENAAYPSGLCAERVAIFAAKSQYPDAKVSQIAVVVHSLDFDVNEPVSPCGACRQVLLEYEMNQDTPISVLCQGMTGNLFKMDRVQDLLPLHFYENRLKKK